MPKQLGQDISSILLCRCPRCGRGKVFSGVLSVVPSCAECGLDLTGGDTGDAGAVICIMLLGAIMAALAVWTEFRFEPPMWLHVVLWPVVALALALPMLRTSKSAMIAMQYRHRSTEMERSE